MRAAWLKAYKLEIERTPNADRKFIRNDRHGLCSMRDLLGAVQRGTKFGIAHAERWMRIRKRRGEGWKKRTLPALEYRINCSFWVRIMLFLGKGSEEPVSLEIADNKLLTCQQLIDEILSGSALGVKIMDAIADLDRNAGLASIAKADDAGE